MESINVAGGQQWTGQIFQIEERRTRSGREQHRRKPSFLLFLRFIKWSTDSGCEGRACPQTAHIYRFQEYETEVSNNMEVKRFKDKNELCRSWYARTRNISVRKKQKDEALIWETTKRCVSKQKSENANVLKPIRTEQPISVKTDTCPPNRKWTPALYYRFSSYCSCLGILDITGMHRWIFL